MQSFSFIDICIVSGSRPSLLRNMLESFNEKLFAHFEIRNVYCNVDPFMGTSEEQKQCELLILSYFANAKIAMPSEPSFGAAVKRLWTNTGDFPVLHLEDDWVLNESVYDDILGSMREDNELGMLVLSMDKHVPEKTEEYIKRKKELRIAGFNFPVPFYRINAFGTSPRFLRPGLAQKFGSLINPNLDPEKQVFRGKNRRLSKYQELYKAKIIWSNSNRTLISDIGRDYRNQLGLEKREIGGESIWVKKNDKI